MSRKLKDPLSRYAYGSSDGSSFLYFWDPETLEEVGRLQVRNKTLAREFKPLYQRLGHMLKLKPDGDKIHFLNELEYINGEVWANVWQTDFILRIDPATGRVNSVVDLTGLSAMTELGSSEAVLNGIAWDADTERLFVTGKHWAHLFEIEVLGP